MEQLLYILLDDNFQTYFNRYGYIGIYIFFVTIDQIAPIPEEISLIVIGYFAAHGVINPFIAGGMSIAAFFTIDTIYYYLTKTGNKLAKKMSTSARSKKMAGYKKKMREHTFKTILILSFIPRMRLLTPVFVALSELPYRKFIFYSIGSLAVFTAIYISLGFIFHGSINSLIEKTSSAGRIIFIAGMVLMTVGVSFLVWRKLKSDK
jgi:membrane protein DedA with SNARE-associated domain